MSCEPHLKGSRERDHSWITNLSENLTHKNWPNVLQICIERIPPTINQFISTIEAEKTNYTDIYLLILWACTAAIRIGTPKDVNKLYNTLRHSYVGRAAIIVEAAASAAQSGKETRPKLLADRPSSFGVEHSLLSSLLSLNAQILCFTHALGLKCRDARSLSTDAASSLLNSGVVTAKVPMTADFCSEFAFLCGKTFMMSGEDHRFAFAFFFVATLLATEPATRCASLSCCIVAGLRLSVTTKKLCKRTDKHSTATTLTKLLRKNFCTVGAILHGLSVAMAHGDPFTYALILSRHAEKLFSCHFYGVLIESHGAVLLRLIANSLRKKNASDGEYVRISLRSLAKTLEKSLEKLRVANPQVPLPYGITSPISPSNVLTLIAQFNMLKLNPNPSNTELFRIEGPEGLDPETCESETFVHIHVSLLRSPNDALFPREQVRAALSRVNGHNLMSAETLDLFNRFLDDQMIR